jgi:hypothetical protein
MTFWHHGRFPTLMSGTSRANRSGFVPAHPCGTEPPEAGIAADSVTMLANILRRVDQDF